MDKLHTWLQTTPYKNFALSLICGDASFRKYYRLKKDKEHYILMDSSLEALSLTAFLDVTARLLYVGVTAPHIYEKNETLAYLILEDFGDVNLLDVLSEKNFLKYYTHAIIEIIKMQKADTKGLPLYDKNFLHFEMDLMQEWYLQEHLSLQLKQKEVEMLQKSLDKISQVVLSQPQETFVHRDFHSRNIMLTQTNTLAVIDYQDAMNGAITYDLVSLLKDCYISFSRQNIQKLALIFRDKKGLQTSDEEFLKWFDFMGMQRHIKILGVFARLSIRDKKESFLDDIPLTLSYLVQTASRYSETQELAEFLKKVTL